MDVVAVRGDMRNNQMGCGSEANFVARQNLAAKGKF